MIVVRGMRFSVLPAGVSLVLFPAVALLMAGCSADIGRFDTASLGENRDVPAAAPYGDNRGRSSLVGPAYGETPPQGQTSPGGTYYPPPSNRPAPSRFSDLPPPNGANAPTAQAQPYYGGPATVPPVAPRQTAVLPPRGEAIEVKAGDTLYGLSRRHGVAMSEIMALNNLQTQTLRPGQQLYLPATAQAEKPVARAKSYETATAPTGDAPPGWTGTYTVKAGDSLYAIARQQGVKVADLKSANAISEERSLKPGAVLRVPGGGSQATDIAARSAEPSAQSSTKPTLINGSKDTDTRVAEVEKPDTASDADGAASARASGSVAGSGKLRWPVEGKVISGFGPRSDGTHNDGVNLATPMGADVHAAESGVVAYAGSELKGYGNLVLLRHDNGWVTAYAHADELLVKRGDKVKRGQVIAKAGRTGQVDQPQVHFELRQGQRPVDPTPFMERS